MNILKKTKSKRTYQLITNDSPKSAVAEAYRVLRTNLGFAGLDNPCRSVLISSCSPMEGKSTVAANLAVVLAQAGHKTILVDCDLRKPVQHRIFKVDNRQGLTSCLCSQTEVEDVACRDIMDNLSILTSGPIPPNPAEIINSQKIRDLWADLTVSYDYVIIDAPPALAVTDASILATQVDGVIMVVSSASTRNDLARQTKEQFVKANARIIGVVLNKVKVEKHNYNYYYYSDDEAAGK